ncbi:MAG TPA: glycosyltransferase family 4 protein [Acidimicrobiales bacterium]|nr:glycosyltransferase family 4 protein [Acidimicrobiales bacterium]
MRVAQVCPYSLSIPGGVQGQVLGLARAQRRHGHDVTVLAPSDGPPPESGVRTLGRSVPLAANGSVAPIAPDVACARRTIAALRDGDYDVLHLHEPMVPGPTLTALLYSDLPVVGTFHRSGASAAYAGFGPLLVRWARRIDIRVAVSADARHTAESALGGDYEMLFNGVDVEAFTGPVPTPTSGPTVLFIGRHEERKGLVVLLEALTLMADPPELWVAGDGPQTDELKARYRAVTGIRWLGRISDTERASRMKGADLCCFPSLGGESFGLVLLEAMAAGTPVVAGDIDGYRSVVTDGADGLLVPPADPAALAATLTQALSDPELRARLRAAGSERAAAYSMNRLAEAYGDLYSRVTEMKKSRPEGRPFFFHSAR